MRLLAARLASCAADHGNRNDSEISGWEAILPACRTFTVANRGPSGAKPRGFSNPIKLCGLDVFVAEFCGPEVLTGSTKSVFGLTSEGKEFPHGAYQQY